MTIEPGSLTRLGRRQRWRAARQQGVGLLKKSCFSWLGPGLITGASDDDPSGIATYSQAGAQLGFGLLWSMLFTIPLMAAFQEICARIGRTTGRGLARNMRLNYSAWIVNPLVVLLVLTNIVNLGADINAMGAALGMLIGGPRVVYAIGFTVASLVLQVWASYARYTAILRWLAMVLVLYVAATFAVRPHWGEVAWATFIPQISFSGDYLAVLVAVLGTTISPYLFFWQASLESEETKIAPGEEALLKAPERSRAEFRRIRLDTAVGMVLSNFIGFCIMVCAAATLHEHHITEITSADQAAQALGPIAPPMVLLGHTFSVAPLLFALGIIGGGLLAIPVLAGSAAYAVGEIFRWPVGMDRLPMKAKGFYGVLIVSTLLGAGMVLTPLNPMKALVWAAIANGVAAVPIMILIMMMFSNRRVMGRFVQISKPLRVTGWVATAAMTAAAVGMFATLGR
jgi:NRAMP (natural resistance-associated macrophage protein)-like metal ion transporter